MKKQKLAKLRKKAVALKAKIDGGRGTLQDVIELNEVRSVISSQTLKLPKIPKTVGEVAELKMELMRSYEAEQDPDKKEEYANAVKHCDRLTKHIKADERTTKRKRNTTGRAKSRFGFLLVLVLLCLSLFLFFSGCSGGASLAVSVGGSIHDPKHPDLAKIVEATPIMSTSATKQFALPMVPGGGK